MRKILPIHTVVDDIKEALRYHTRLILRADPGAGKSTALPLELMDEPWLKGRKILMLEPRRLAARMVAERMAETLGEKVGERVGYRMRGETRVGPATRIEVLTEGILGRLMRQDPALESTGLLIFDEFHERSLQSDLGLALALQSQELLREDLRILVMSATLNREGLLGILGDETPLIESAGRCYPVEERYLPSRDPIPTPDALPDAVAGTIRRALKEEKGSILAFLPGAAEIRRCHRLLSRGSDDGVIVAPLYGALSPAEQRRAVTPAPRGKRKIVLATNIAETSLTIEGISIVVDGGYHRQVRYDALRGMNRMLTLPVSADSATQRAGRAGRTAPGVCYRLWARGRPLAPHAEAEILRADLAPLVLELAAWGAEAGELAWIDPPPSHALESAVELLRRLEMLDEKLRITPMGEAALELGEHPRIAHMLLRARKSGLQTEAALLAAILSERPPLRSSHLGEIMEEVRRSLERNDPSSRRLADSFRRTARKLGIREALPSGEGVRTEAVGLLVALTYPERLAQRRGKSDRYRSAGGRGLRLLPGDPLGRYELLAVAEAGGTGAETTIRLAAPVTLPELREHGLIRCEDRLEFNEESGRVEARRIDRCGALILESRPIPLPRGSDPAKILLEAIRRQGLGPLPHTGRSESLRTRINLLHRHLGPPWPDLTDRTLLQELERWLLPWLEGMRSMEDLAELNMRSIWEGFIGWERLGELERLVPERITLPSGSSVSIDYSDPDAPVLAAKLQECFGWRKTPKILEGRLPLTIHLLSPARRPLAVTRDLESFWRDVYPEVRREMRGRYPKHPWPEDPFTAEATARTKRASGGKR